MNRLRDNQALRDEVEKIVRSAALRFSNDPAIGGYADSILKTADRALTATGPVSGALGVALATAERLLREAHACATVRDDGTCQGCPTGDYLGVSDVGGDDVPLHLRRAPQTDHRAAPAASGFPEPAPGELGFRKGLAATPSSGSPPGAAEALFKAYQAKRDELNAHRNGCTRCGDPNRFPAACATGNRLYDETKAALSASRRSPPESPDGSTRRMTDEQADVADCTCHFECREDSHSGQWHQHEDDPCPRHPGAPVVG